MEFERMKDSLIVGIVMVGLIFGSFGFFVARDTLASKFTQTQIVNATTDYFSWSCQQLKDRINTDIDAGGLYSANGSVASARGLEANNLLQILEFNGCPKVSLP